MEHTFKIVNKSKINICSQNDEILTTPKDNKDFVLKYEIQSHTYIHICTYYKTAINENSTFLAGILLLLMHWNYCNKFYLPNYMFTLHIPSSRTCKNEMLLLRCCLVTFPASPLVTYSSVFTRCLPGSPFKQKSQGAMQARSTCIIPSSLIKIHSALLYFVIIHIISIKRSLQARFFCRLSF